MSIKTFTEKILFGSKWLLLLFYLGLIIGQMCYAWVFLKEVLHIFHELNLFTKETILITLLELVDMVMIANLVKMIITGSYNSSVSKEHGYQGENTTSGVMKIKMGSTLIGVSSIHLLQTFLNTNSTWDEIYKQLMIHTMFIIGSVALSYIEYLHDKGEHFNPTHIPDIHTNNNQSPNNIDNHQSKH